MQLPGELFGLVAIRRPERAQVGSSAFRPAHLERNGPAVRIECELETQEAAALPLVLEHGAYTADKSRLVLEQISVSGRKLDPLACAAKQTRQGILNRRWSLGRQVCGQKPTRLFDGFSALLEDRIDPGHEGRRQRHGATPVLAGTAGEIGEPAKARRSMPLFYHAYP